jgi:hypothetical protein
MIHLIQKILKIPKDKTFIIKDYIKEVEVKKLWKTVPELELRLFLIMYNKLIKEKKENVLTPEKYKKIIAVLFRSLKICSCCEKIKPESVCACCKLVYYCNIECQKRDWKRHKLWCCKHNTEYTIHPFKKTGDVIKKLEIGTVVQILKNIINVCNKDKK